MKFPLHSLRTSVTAHLAFLILSAMLLMNVVTVKYTENHFLQSELRKGRLLNEALVALMHQEIEDSPEALQELKANDPFKTQVSRLLGESRFQGAMFLNRAGTLQFQVGAWSEAEKKAVSLSRECLSIRKSCFDFTGSTWGVIWLAPDRVHLSAPLILDGRLMGAMTVGTRLGPLYENLRDSENVFILYIILNTIIFVFFGIYLLSRTVVKPIHGLLKITESYKDAGSVPPLSDASPDEIGQLSRSLNAMLQHLDRNKNELKENIASLEKANLELKRAQNEVIRSEKLASVGRLATGVAHEIGNPIGIVLGYLDLLKSSQLSETEKEDFIARMEAEITRINQIIRDLLDFSRTSSGPTKPVYVHDLIAETLEMLNPQPMVAHMEMTPDFGATNDQVWADPNQLKQVFLNVIINAADAVKEGGKLDIHTENQEAALKIRFADTGPGIKPEDLMRVFDPFYTTKEPGKGTGLGLSVCYNIIQMYQGEIHTESDGETGTTIVIALPLYQASVDEDEDSDMI